MAQVTYSGNKESIPAPIGEVYEFITDFRNFKSLMPDQAENWEATKDTCRFTIRNLATISLAMKERIPPDRVIIEPNEPLPVDIRLICSLSDTSDKTTEAQIQLHAGMSQMMKMMLSNPFQNLVKIMGERLREHFGG